jgi:protein SCO1/2
VKTIVRTRGAAALLGLPLAIALGLAACSRAPRPSCCSRDETPAAAALGAPAMPAALPDTSVWQIDHEFRDQTGAVRHLGDFRGRPVVVAMIFTHCRFACPAIVAQIQRLVERVAERDDVHVVLASMDAARDEPPVLAAFAKEHALPAARYTLLHGSAFAVRELAAVLGVRFAEVEGGDFSHANQIALLDHDGRIVARSEGLGTDPAALVDAIAKLPRR